MYNDYKTPEDRLNKAGTNDWVGLFQACILGIITAMVIGIISGALSVLL